MNTVIKKPHILIVDDSSMNLSLFGKILERLGFSFSTAESGEEALQQLQEHYFDLVLMDCMMPGLDGFETTRLIRDSATAVRNNTIPVIAVTAHITTENRELCRVVGMNDFLEKPVTVNRLTEIISKWTGNLPTEVRK